MAAHVSEERIHIAHLVSVTAGTGHRSDQQGLNFAARALALLFSRCVSPEWPMQPTAGWSKQVFGRICAI